MVTKYKQIRYYTEEAEENYPPNLKLNDLTTGKVFSPYYPMTQLGIQAPPGTKFYINGSENPAIIGFTGIFELDLTSGGSIIDLYFDTKTLGFIRDNINSNLTIDLVYQEGVIS